MDKAILREFAKRYFVFDDGLSSANLVRKIQLAQGEVACFATGRAECANANCRWRKECGLEVVQNSQVDCHQQLSAD